MRRIGFSLSIAALFLLVAVFSFSQTPPQKTDKPPDPAQKPELLVDQWFIRLNALDDWWITVDGLEQPEPVVDRFLELYSPDAFHEVQPSENQAGHVIFHGHDGVRKWTTDFAKKYVQLAYRIDYMTRAEKPVQLFYSTKPPWGGTAAAVEFSAVYTNRQDRKRIFVPGSAFFLFDDSGKIQRVRLYLLRDETTEIEP